MKKISIIFLTIIFSSLGFFALFSVPVSSFCAMSRKIEPLAGSGCPPSGGSGGGGGTLQCPSPPSGYKLINPGIPSGSLCRGACGADCDPDACTVQNPFTVCVASGGQHRICTYTGSLRCGSHPGCVDHDSCYDNCAANGETNLCYLGGLCHCACDALCIAEWGATNCSLWALGLGPKPNTLFFSNPPNAGPILNGLCP